MTAIAAAVVSVPATNMTMASEINCSLLNSTDLFSAAKIIFLNIVQVPLVCICWNPESDMCASSKNPFGMALRL